MMRDTFSNFNGDRRMRRKMVMKEGEW